MWNILVVCLFGIAQPQPPSRDSGFILTLCLASVDGIESVISPTDQKHFADAPILGWFSEFVVDKALQKTAAMTTSFHAEQGIYIHHFIVDHTVRDFRLLDWTAIILSSVK